MEPMEGTDPSPSPGRLTDLRHLLHSRPELSGSESRTAAILAAHLRETSPDRLLEGLGGNGLAAIYNGTGPGPDILLRCEMDALPIPETTGLPYSSTTPGISHACGHDGHMTMMIGAAGIIARQRPATGSVTLLFQPSEETGNGAEALLAGPLFDVISPRMVFAMHNIPGFPLGNAVAKDGVFCKASRGLVAKLEGRSSHAAEPDRGNSPAPAVARIISGLTELQERLTDEGVRSLITVIHVRVGEVSFGTTPSSGTVMATLRADSHPDLMLASARMESLVGDAAGEFALYSSVSWTEEFPAVLNDAGAVRLVESAADGLGMSVVRPAEPFPWSEDFGHLTGAFPGALFGLGAGTDHPPLHDGSYDFPDDVIAPGVSILCGIVYGILGKTTSH